MLDRFRKILKEGAPSAARLAEELAAARKLVAAAATDLQRLTALRTTLLTADDAARQRNRTEINGARDQQEDAALYVAELSRRHAAAEQAEAQQRKLTAYNDAVRQRDEAVRLLRKEYPAAARKILEVLRVVAESDLAVASVNADLPAGAERVDGSEAHVAVTHFGADMQMPVWASIQLPGLRGDPAYLAPVVPVYDGFRVFEGDPAETVKAIDAALTAPRSTDAKPPDRQNRQGGLSPPFFT